MESLSAKTAGTGAVPQTPPHFCSDRFTEKHLSHAAPPSVAGRRLAGGGQKNFELVGYDVTFFLVIEALDLLANVLL
jgi:hypothetical protein